jgi:hypothetical protein
LVKFGVLANPTLFFLLKNFFMMFENVRRILIIYFAYKECKLQKNQMNNIIIVNDLDD